MNDLISVIVPIYGVEDYLDKCVNSIANQTYKNLEIILVDDGGLDKCPEICDKYARRDRRIRVIHKQNGGQSEARNFGIDIAKGKYLAFVDGDDWIESTMIEHLYSTCEKFNVGMSTCARYLTDGETVNGTAFVGEQRVYSSEEAMNEILAGKSMDVAPWDKLYRSELFEKIRFPVGEVNEDIAIFYKLIDRACRIAHCGTAEYYYRNRPGSTTKLTYKYEVRKIIEKNLRGIEEFVNNKYPTCKNSFERYKVVNIYALLNKYIKCNGCKGEEYTYLLKRFIKMKKTFFKDKQTPKKEKIIAGMILMRIYSPYLDVKKVVTGHK